MLTRGPGGPTPTGRNVWSQDLKAEIFTPHTQWVGVLGNPIDNFTSTDPGRYPDILVSETAYRGLRRKTVVDPTKTTRTPTSPRRLVLRASGDRGRETGGAGAGETGGIVLGRQVQTCGRMESEVR